MSYALTVKAVSEIQATPDALFDYLDDYARLGAHMTKPSMRMMGGRMTYEFDESSGRAVGSIIRLAGSFLGIGLFVEEVVTERDPPRRKVWETREMPRLLTIGSYRMSSARFTRIQRRSFDAPDVAHRHCTRRKFRRHSIVLHFGYFHNFGIFGS